MCVWGGEGCLPGLVSYWLPDTPVTQSLTMCPLYSPLVGPLAGGHGNGGVQSSSLAAYLKYRKYTSMKATITAFFLLDFCDY